MGMLCWVYMFLSGQGFEIGNLISIIGVFFMVVVVIFLLVNVIWILVKGEYVGVDLW